MRLLILAAALAAPSSVSSAPAAPPQAVSPPGAPPAPISGRFTENCRRPDVIPADVPATPEAKRLGELPPGDLILTVYREVDGCMEPMIVRYGEGRGPQDAVEPPRPRARIWRKDLGSGSSAFAPCTRSVRPEQSRGARVLTLYQRSSTSLGTNEVCDQPD